MDLRLITNQCRPDGIFGCLMDCDGQVIAVTLEHSYDCVPKLPRGAAYLCKRGVHKLHNGIPFETFEVTGVPGHSGILFHIGNKQEDSEGCVLVGEAQAGSMITYSRDAFREFMSLQAGLESFHLEVV